MSWAPLQIQFMLLTNNYHVYISYPMKVLHRLQFSQDFPNGPNQTTAVSAVNNDSMWLVTTTGISTSYVRLQVPTAAENENLHTISKADLHTQGKYQIGSNFKISIYGTIFPSDRIAQRLHCVTPQFWLGGLSMHVFGRVSVHLTGVMILGK